MTPGGPTKPGGPPEPEDAHRIDVRAGAGDYPVLVGEGLLEAIAGLVARHAPAHRYAVISDDRVADLYGADVVARLAAAGHGADLFTFPRGEASKTRATWARLTDAMLEAGLGRDAAVVAVGGGVTGDLAGFVAATYMRGIPVVQVPTSLVAMIDSSVGGKTGVDAPRGKNLVGAFHPPAAVIADPVAGLTLPPRERAQGLAEALKHGAVADPAYFHTLAADAPQLMDGDVAATRRAVRRSVEIKAEVVSADEREGGLRQILNFGHTVGHALEAASAYALGHGDAVAAGMIVEAVLGERLGVTAAGTSAVLAEALGSFGLGACPPLEPATVLRFLSTDKKARRGAPRFVLLTEPGRVWAEGGYSHEVEEDAVRSALESVLTHGG